MDKLKLTGQNLGLVCKSKLRHVYFICHAIAYITKGTNLKLKTQPKQLLGSLPLAFALPDVAIGIFAHLPSLLSYLFLTR
jgi:hypothetical protein